MLRTRIITATILSLVFLAGLFLLSHNAWIIATFAVMLLAFWEWSKISQFSDNGTKVFLAISFLIGVLLIFLLLNSAANSPSLFLISSIIASIFLIIVVPIWLYTGWRPKHAALFVVTGWIIVFPTWLALIAHHATSPRLLLALMALVWTADISAYFSGKAFGRHKLAPSISPGKTWEGVFGAVICVIIYSVIISALAQQLGYIQKSGLSFWLVVIIGSIGLSAASVLGDLFESWMKRGAALKDSSNLLPGHGGILDRIDALTSTLPVALCLFWVFNELISA